MYNVFLMFVAFYTRGATMVEHNGSGDCKYAQDGLYDI